MSNYMYYPSDVGKEVESNRGTFSKVRKYHLTPDEIVLQKKEWEESVQDVPQVIRDMAHPNFFNPYRKGIYWGQIQALYLLGANQWHPLSKIISKTSEILREVPVYYKDRRSGSGIKTNVWDRFVSKTPKASARRCKDVLGRIQENMLFFQRLSKLHPSGYKLRQACASVDFKKISSKDFPRGEFLYRLSTYGTEEEALPLRDFSEYNPDSSERKYISYRFIGKIVTCDKILISGKECRV